MNILTLPAWFPSPESPLYGLFVVDHVQAAALYYDEVVVVYPEQQPARHPFSGSYCISSDRLENGTRTIRFWPQPTRPRGTGFIRQAFAINGIINWLTGNGFRPDVLHAHVFTAGAIAVIAGRRWGIPVVVTEHSTAFPRRALSLRQWLLARIALQGADMVLPVSHPLQTAIEKYHIPASFRVVPNPVNTDLFVPPKTDDQRTDSRPPRMLSLGCPEPHKGWHFLLQACHNLQAKGRSFRLDLIGDGPDQAEYKQMCLSLGLGEVVHFWGYISRDEVIEMLQGCDFFVLPSLHETFSITTVEAMACGKPVVATRCGGPEQFVTEETGLLVPAGDAQALAQAIDHMLDAHSTYDPWRLANYVRNRFSFQAVGKQLHSIYTELGTRKK